MTIIKTNLRALSIITLIILMQACGVDRSEPTSDRASIIIDTPTLKSNAIFNRKAEDDLSSFPSELTEILISLSNAQGELLEEFDLLLVEDSIEFSVMPNQSYTLTAVAKAGEETLFLGTTALRGLRHGEARNVSISLASQLEFSLNLQVDGRPSDKPVDFNIAVGTEKVTNFGFELTGLKNNSVTWYVNDIPGGNSTVGTITEQGDYTPPVVLPETLSIQLKAVPVSAPSFSATFDFELYEDSENILPPAASINTPGGVFNTPQSITLSCDSCSNIYYTLNGDTPSVNDTLYATSILITETTVVRFITVYDNGDVSDDSQYSFIIDNAIPTSQATPPAGTYNTTQTVNLSCLEQDCSRIHFAVGENTLDLSSPVYSSPIIVSTSQIIRFFAVDLAGNIEPINSASYIIQTQETDVDSDGDGMSDNYEIAYGLNPNDATDAIVDSDDDGLTNLQEFQNSTDPNSSDSDGDTLSDFEEIALGLDPTLVDTDGDTFSDGIEINAETDPLDNSSYPTPLISQNQTYTLMFSLLNETASDQDGDGLSLAEERQYGTDPTTADTDEDGVNDYIEIALGTSPLNIASVPSSDELPKANAQSIVSLLNSIVSDQDGDGLSLAEERQYGTDPTIADTDEDGVNDYIEIVLGTSPLNISSVPSSDELPKANAQSTASLLNSIVSDQDGDGLSLTEERQYGTDPTIADTDNDGVNDYIEIVLGTSPLDIESVPFSDELPRANAQSTVSVLNSIASDQDGDGLSLAEERQYGTNPTLVDTDGDNVSDFLEIKLNSDPLDSADFPTFELLPKASPVTSPISIINAIIEDADGDGLTLLQEKEYGTDPNLSDSDNDNVDDFTEIMLGTDPTDILDTPGFDLIPQAEKMSPPVSINNE